MSDLDQTKKTNFTQNQNTGASQNLKDQMVDAGAEMKQRAGDALRASTDVARDKFKEAADAAKDVASGTAELRSSSSLVLRSVCRLASPVMFPPGLARLATWPVPTGSA